MSFTAILITIVFFTTSCSKNATETEEISAPVPVETFVEAKILSKKADLCLLGRDSAMHSLIKLSSGDNIPILEIDGIIDTKFIPDEETRPNADLNTAEKDKETSEPETPVQLKGTEYYHAVYDNLDFWIEKSVLALNCETAVAIEKTYLYTNDSLSEKLNTPQNPLKFATIIAKSTTGEQNLTAEKIYYYDTTAKSVQEAFVDSSSISARIDDIVVSQVVEALKTTTRATPRNELFKKAAKYKPCPKVLVALNAQKTETKSYNYQEVLKSMQRMSFGVNVDELMTVDQSKDPFK